MGDLSEEVREIAAATGFSGVVAVDRGGRTELAQAHGMACRSHGVANTLDTRFGVASGTKGLTALTVGSLVHDGLLDLAAPVRRFLGDDLPGVDDAVTVEHLLGHRSGIGDYIDEQEGFDPTAHVLPVPVHELATTEDYLRVLDRHPAKFAPGERFSYCNSGYVVLALVAERAAGMPFPDLVDRRVCRPAGMRHTAFLRSDELPASAARGYLSRSGLRTNVLHLPVRGSGDGGAYSTVADVHALWRAMFAARVVPAGLVQALVAPRSDVPEESMRYGLGFWLHATGEAVLLVGCDAGVSFRSLHDPGAQRTVTVVSNTHDGAWPLARHLDAALLE